MSSATHPRDQHGTSSIRRSSLFQTVDDTRSSLVDLLSHHTFALPEIEHRSSFILYPPDDMNTSRKFSYTSVKEESGDGLPQSFESSLSSQDLEEVEWIAWPCSEWCKTKGICSHHYGGSHDDHVKTRLEGYARSNPRKLEKILDELEKRRTAQKLFNLPFAKDILQVHPRAADFSLQIWREKVRQSILEGEELVGAKNDCAIADDSDSIYEVPITAGTSRLESMPEEIQNMIFSFVTTDHTADPYARPRIDLASCALTSKSLHDTALRVMYRHVSIPQSKAFMKFMRSLRSNSQLGRMVRWLDFSHYSNMGFGSTRTTRKQTPYLTPTTLLECLEQLPNLRAFLVHEHIDEELSVEVLQKLFSLPLMTALDFCACSSRPFTEAFTAICTANADAGPLPSIQRLSLHECGTLPDAVFKSLLPRLRNLTHLDVAHTLITDSSLLSIPPTARITHLNLERCTRLSGPAVVKFLTTHPAASSIVYLNLAADSSRHRLLGESELTTLLPRLPGTLRSLNINGSRISPTHIPDLRGLATRLEELAIRGANLDVGADVTAIFGISSNPDAPATPTKSTLRYIDLSDVKAVSQMSLAYSPRALMGPETLPLEVLELGSSMLGEIKRRATYVKKPEWVVQELGRRGWYVRQLPDGVEMRDDGWRPYKMGARWWGMRKIPVVEQDVGGMYGYFMFKRS